MKRVRMCECMSNNFFNKEGHKSATHN